MSYIPTREEAASYHSKRIDVVVERENRHSCHGHINVAIDGKIVRTEDFSDIDDGVKTQVKELVAWAYRELDETNDDRN